MVGVARGGGGVAVGREGRSYSIRRSAITDWLNENHAKQLVSDRMDVSEDILEKHYDARTESEERKLRKDAFDIS